MTYNKTSENISVREDAPAGFSGYNVAPSSAAANMKELFLKDMFYYVLKRLPTLCGMSSLSFQNADEFRQLLTVTYPAVGAAKWVRHDKEYTEEVFACAKISLRLLAHIMSLPASCMYHIMNDVRGGNRHEVLYKEYEGLLMGARATIGNQAFIDHIVEGMNDYLEKFPIIAKPAAANEAGSKRKVNPASDGGAEAPLVVHLAKRRSSCPADDD